MRPVHGKHSEGTVRAYHFATPVMVPRTHTEDKDIASPRIAPDSSAVVRRWTSVADLDVQHR